MAEVVRKLWFADSASMATVTATVFWGISPRVEYRRVGWNKVTKNELIIVVNIMTAEMTRIERTCFLMVVGLSLPT
jgi:hypothetical protein